MAMDKALRKALTWFYFIPYNGDAGRSWYESFLSSGGMDMCLDLELALELARRKGDDESRGILLHTFHRLRGLRHATPETLALVLKRQYLGVHAYWRYVHGDYLQATRLLHAASAAALGAIDRAPFLAVLASSEYEFCLHHARIARNQRRWEDMRTHLRRGRAMIRSAEPLCFLPSGKPLFLCDLDDLYLALTPQSDLDREALRILTDKALREAEFEHLARGIEVLGTVVTPF